VSVALSHGTNRMTWEQFAEAHPTNFWVMTRKADELMENRQWADARVVLQRLLDLYPDFTGPESAYRQLIAVHRALGETNSERSVLEKFAVRDDAAVDAYLRLMELASAAKDWPTVVQNAQRFLAVNPLVAPPYRYLADASEHTGQTGTAIQAYRALLELDPPDPASVHLRLAQALHQKGDATARRHVLQALEEAPRYRDALNLLMKINSEAPQPTPAPPTSNSAVPR
jgi:tetratricopeptide (TPR) repeat protein